MKLGILGTGMIANMMIPEFQRCDAFQCAAVYSRAESTGQALAAKYGIPKVYTALEDLLADPDIDMVYVASPNSIHYRQVKAALLAGKHVICEKPFVPTLAEAEELISLAKEQRLFLFEAITTAHHPNYALVWKQLPALGPVKLILSTFCQRSSRYPALLAGQTAPVLDPAYCGGALMDINLYNIHFAVGLFGAPEKVHYYPNLHPNGVDTSGLLVLEYSDFLCQCVGAKDCDAQNSTQILGNNGSICVTPGSNTCHTMELRLRGQAPHRTVFEESPWYYEVQEIGRILAAQDLDTCYAMLETTRQVVFVLEQARKDANLSF